MVIWSPQNTFLEDVRLSRFDSFKISFLVNDVGLFHCVMHGNNVNPANIYLLKFNNKNTRRRCEKCSKLTIKTPERRH